MESEWKPQESLSEGDFKLFSEAYIRDLKRTREALVRARLIIQDQEAVIKIRLRSLNDLKAAMYKYDINIED